MFGDQLGGDDGVECGTDVNEQHSHVGVTVFEVERAE